MNLRRTLARDRRLNQLDARRTERRLTDAERAEYVRLDTARDQHWRWLPRRIEAARRKLATLEAYARDVGLTPDESASA